MAKLGDTFFGPGLGIAPKQIGASEATEALQANNYEGTLFVVRTGAIAGSLTLTVQDSADGSSWDPVAGGVLVASATSRHLIYVRHSSVREYVRVHAAGVTNPVASITPVQLNDRMGPGGSVDLYL